MASPLTLESIFVEAAASSSREDLFAALVAVLSGRADVLQDLVDWAVPEHVYGPMKSLTNMRCSGVIKSFSEKNGYGFISSPEIIEAFGMDMFVSDKQMKFFHAGDAVNFAILSNKGKPQAFDLAAEASKVISCGKGFDMLWANTEAPVAKSYGKVERKPFPAPPGSSAFAPPHGVDPAWSIPATGLTAANPFEQLGMMLAQTGKTTGMQTIGATSSRLNPNGPAPASKVSIQGITDERYIGLVKSFKPGKFGFLSCEDSRINAQDIYVHWDQLGSFKVGDIVSFGVIVNEKNGVKAVNLGTADDDSGSAKRARF